MNKGEGGYMVPLLEVSLRATLTRLDQKRVSLIKYPPHRIQHILVRMGTIYLCLISLRPSKTERQPPRRLHGRGGFSGAEGKSETGGYE
jgi:hypothetical protein